MKTTHELIDQDHPVCLYCANQCNIGLNSSWLPASSIRADLEILTCTKCEEEFEIHSMQSLEGVTSYIGFSFTCAGYYVYHSIVESYFDISTHAKNRKHIITIPAFEVDFSDKEKLHDKLKTYILFS